MALPISRDCSGIGFHAFLRDDKGVVKSELDRRKNVIWVDANPDLSIRRLDDQWEMPTYEISRKKISADMDSDEQFKVTLLTGQDINNAKTGDRLSIKSGESTWFTQVGHVAIRKADGIEQPSGTLMMVNPANVSLLKEDSQNSDAPEELDRTFFQMLEMLPASCRQNALYQHYEFKGLPRPVVVDDPVLSQWPLLNRLGERYADSKLKLPESIEGVIRDMSFVVETMASMHEQKVAHGDIKLDKLRRFDDRVGPGNPERFSVVGEQPGPDKLGEKRFTFYNNAWHAPELRFPGEVDDKPVLPEPERRFPKENLIKKTILKPWQYTPATKEGDVWSFGSLLAVMICRIPGGRALLEEEGVLQLSLSDSMTASGQFTTGVFHKGCEKFLLDKRSLLELNLPKQGWLPEQGDTTPLPGDAEKLGQLVALAKDCTDPDPEKRPGAESVYKRLGAIK